MRQELNFRPTKYTFNQSKFADMIMSTFQVIANTQTEHKVGLVIENTALWAHKKEMGKFHVEKH